MTISNNGIAFIKQHEGLRLAAYQCSAGKWTIGYGHTGVDTAKGKTITLEEAEDLLRRDLEQYEQAVNEALYGLDFALRSIGITQNQFDALTSLCYNIGVAAFAGSTLMKRFRASPRDPLIAGEFLKWVNAGGRYSEGLHSRRMNEQKLYFLP